jgi:multiubiquitin
METEVRETKGGKEHLVTITVNEKPVEIEGPRVTGLEIKQAAIAQGVKIELSFVLSEELPNRKTRIVGDTDVVTLTKHSRFVAVAPDDNS